MRIIVWVKANSKSDLLTKIGRDEYRASVRVGGSHQAITDALLKVVASHFSVASSWVQVVAGKVGNRKVLEIIGKSSD